MSTLSTYTHNTLRVAFHPEETTTSGSLMASALDLALPVTTGWSCYCPGLPAYWEPALCKEVADALIAQWAEENRMFGLDLRLSYIDFTIKRPPLGLCYMLQDVDHSNRRAPDFDAVHVYRRLSTETTFDGWLRYQATFSLLGRSLRRLWRQGGHLADLPSLPTIYAAPHCEVIK